MPFRLLVYFKSSKGPNITRAGVRTSCDNIVELAGWSLLDEALKRKANDYSVIRQADLERITNFLTFKICVLRHSENERWNTERMTGRQYHLVGGVHIQI